MLSAGLWCGAGQSHGGGGGGSDHPHGYRPTQVTSLGAGGVIVSIFAVGILIQICLTWLFITMTLLESSFQKVIIKMSGKTAGIFMNLEKHLVMLAFKTSILLKILVLHVYQTQFQN